MTLRPATPQDWEAIWRILEPVIRAGETYTYPRDMSAEEARRVWMELPRQSYVALIDDKIVGTYYLKSNQSGGGDHVCNCGYMVAPSAQGKGVATAMCRHSQCKALALGYRAMQFNFVVSTNTRAVALWHRLGFETVGRLPEAFRHPRLGYVDALVMYKMLTEEEESL